MNLNQLSISITGDEIAEFIRTTSSRMSAAAGKPADGLSDVAIEIKGGYLVISTKKKMGFMPMTISGKVGLRPAVDGEGIVVTLAKISAGFVGSEAIAAQVMSEIGRSLTGVPGCSVSGNDITLTKAALADKLPWLAIPGKITRFGVENDTLQIAIG